jgi:tetratricopeptide (TPR) repeat protein
MALSDKNTENKPKPPTRRGASERISRLDDEEEEDIVAGPLSMSGIRNGLLHSTLTKFVMGLLIFIFAIASILLSGRMPGSMGPATGPGGQRAGVDPVAKVDGESVPLAQFQRSLQSQMQFSQMYGQKIGPAELLGMEQSSLQSLVASAAQYSAAVKAGISASEADIDAEITRLIDEQIKNEKGQDEGAFRRQVESKFPGGESEYRDTMRKDYSRELVAKSLVLKKFEESVKEANKVTEDDYKKSVTRLQLRQIVIRPEVPGPEAKDFKAALEKNGQEALAKAQKIADSLKGKTGPALTQAFIAAAKKDSADTATKAKGGELGSKLPAELPVDAATKEALIKADGSLVGPLQDASSRDVSIFLIENRKLELPKDYAKNKAKLLKDYETQRDNEVWGAKQEEITKAATPEIYAPALLAYKLQTEGINNAPEAERDGLRKQALAKYEEALPSAFEQEATAIRYQMSLLYRELRQPAKVVEILQAAIKSDPNTPKLRLDLAAALRDDKKNKEALEQLKEASKALDENPSQPSPFGGPNPDDQIRQQLAVEFSILGENKLAEAERKKIKPAGPPGMGGMGGMGGSPIRINPAQ